MLAIAADPKILYPAPGLPQFLGAQTAGRVDCIVTADGHDEDIARWAQGVELVCVHDDHRLRLGDLRITPLDRANPPELVGAAVQLGLSASRLLRLSFAIERRPESISQVHDDRRFALYDLQREGQLVRQRCIAIDLGSDPGAPLRLAFGSDLHVASIWDTIDQAMARYAPDLHPHFLHPGRLLRAFVALANRLAASGELDLVVFGGDLVDHVRPDAHVATSGSNVDHFLEILADLTLPCCMIPGNHDFRLHPWRPRIYPYESVAIPPRRAAAVLRRAGLWDALPLRTSDLRALQTTDEQGRSALSEHLEKLAPTGDFDIDLATLRLTFLSTGRDVLPRWRSIERERIGALIRALPGSWEHPDSEGLAPAQIDRVRAAIGQDKGAAVFFHAPLFNPTPGVKVEDHVARIDPGSREDTKSATNFERKLFRSGLRQGVFFRNPAALVRTLSSAARPVAVFSGHVHHTHAMHFDPSDLTIRSTPLPWRPGDARSVSFLNAPALGQTAMQAGEEPGFLHATFVDGRLNRVDKIALTASSEI